MVVRHMFVPYSVKYLRSNINFEKKLMMIWPFPPGFPPRFVLIPPSPTPSAYPI